MDVKFILVDARISSKELIKLGIGWSESSVGVEIVFSTEVL